MPSHLSKRDFLILFLVRSHYPTRQKSFAQEMKVISQLGSYATVNHVMKLLLSYDFSVFNHVTFEY